MKIKIKEKKDGYYHINLIWLEESILKWPLTLDEIEDLEINLTDIIKQLQDYRLSIKDPE